MVDNREQLERLYEATEGQVLIDDIDVKRLRKAAGLELPRDS